MKQESYTPGCTENTMTFMRRRRAETHAAFFLPYLKPNMRLLDCGCGPGTITLGLARRVRPGEVIGFDLETSQTQASVLEARLESLPLRFQAGSIYSLPFPGGSFDAVFSHAVFEHLREPALAVAEVRRVLRPGGVIALRTPDWGGFLVHPDATEAISLYKDIQTANGGNVYAGRYLKQWLLEGGFENVSASASYEVHPDNWVIADFLARTIEDAPAAAFGRAPGAPARIAAQMRRWAQSPPAMFAQAWGEAIGVNPA